MASYQLRDVPTEIWDAFVLRAKGEGWPLRPLLLQLMTDYGHRRIDPSGPPPPEPLVEYAWLRPMFRDITLTPEYEKHRDAAWGLLVQMVRHRKPGAEQQILRLPPEKRTELLAWLTATTPLSPTGANRLSLRAAGAIWAGPDMTKNRRVYQYDVVGLPPGEHAIIVDLYGGWRVQRFGRDGAQAPVSETGYPDARTALAALEAIVAQEA